MWNTVKEHNKTYHQNIPEKKWKRKLWDTAVGLFAIALAIFLEWKFPNLPDLMLIVLVAYGTFCIRSDVVKKFVGFAPAAIADVRNAIGGKKPNGQQHNDT
jgi:MFS superfamily sulfate permease-like transporter